KEKIVLHAPPLRKKKSLSSQLLHKFSSGTHCADKTQTVDRHLETTSTALNVSGDHIDQMSPRDGSPVKTSSPRRPSAQDHGNQ
ncbi:hypothetical protein M9458_049858, partial [Cirrhinus mrigala]